MEKYNLDTIDKEVDELTDIACRRQLKEHKHALYFIISKLIRRLPFENEYKSIPPELAEKITQKLTILGEFSKKIAEIIDLYDCGYVKDILNKIPIKEDNLKSWDQYFKDRGIDIKITK